MERLKFKRRRCLRSLIRWAIVVKATSQGAGELAMDSKFQLSVIPAGGIAFASDGLLPFTAADHEHR